MSKLSSYQLLIAAVLAKTPAQKRAINKELKRRNKGE